MSNVLPMLQKIENSKICSMNNDTLWAKEWRVFESHSIASFMNIKHQRINYSTNLAISSFVMHEAAKDLPCSKI